jgi:hypothetical protein
MKYVKMLGLLAVAAAALMAFAGTASATLTDGEGKEPSTIHAESVGAASLTGSLTVTCQKNTVGGTVTTNDANEVSGTITTLTFEECGSDTVEALSKGTLHLTESDGTVGTLYSNGASVTVLTHRPFIGTVHCIYDTNNTDLGTFTEAHHNPGTGKYETATLHVNSISLERTTTSFGCGTHSTWEVTFRQIFPHTSILD